MAADDAFNYGAIGVVIGHEMTHGFDDQGCQFDKDGNMINWWTEEDKAAFDARTKVMEEAFNRIEVAPGVHANGAFTLGVQSAEYVVELQRCGKFHADRLLLPVACSLGRAGYRGRPMTAPTGGSVPCSPFPVPRDGEPIPYGAVPCPLFPDWLSVILRPQTGFLSCIYIHCPV
jgi:hypothetical protein